MMAVETPAFGMPSIRIAIAEPAGVCGGEPGSSTMSPLVEASTHAGLVASTARAMLRA